MTRSQRRFGLRSLFVVTLVISIVIQAMVCTWQYHLHMTPHERAVSSVEGRDGYVIQDGEGFVEVWFRADAIPITDRSVRDLLGCEKLRILHAENSDISCDGVLLLRGHIHLEELFLDNCKGISDKCVPHIAQLPSLRKVSLARTSMSRQGVEALRRAQPNCEFRF